jgi:peptide/nickel transport system substrate-binding protein
MQRRYFVGMALAAAAVPLLSACGVGQGPTGSVAPTLAPGNASTQPAAASGQKLPKTGGTFIVAHDTDPILGADTMKTTLSPTSAFTAILNGNGSFVRWAREDLYKIEPGLAESWEADPTFTTWTFKIRDGVVWHDGTPFTAQDGAWWLNLAAFGTRSGDKIRAPAVWASSLGQFDSVSATPDGQHVQVKMKSPSPFMLTAMGTPPNQMGHPRHLMQPLIDQGNVDVAPQDVNYVGTGPFKMSRYDKGSRISLKRFDQYWEKDAHGNALPYLDGIDFAIVPNPNAQDQAFVSGQLDIGSRGADHVLTQDRRDQIATALGDKVMFTNMDFSASQIIFNTTLESPFTDARVRQAVMLWVDKSGYATVAGGLTFIPSLLGRSNPFTSPDFMTWPGFNQSTKEVDRAKAKQLMADAGYANGFDTHMLQRDITQEVGVYIQGQLQGLGINVNLDIVDNAGWVQGGYARKYILNNGSTSTALLPENTESVFNVASKTPTGGGNSAHEDAKIDEYYQQLHAASGDMDKRTQIWRQLEHYWLVDQAYTVPLGGRLWVIPYRSYVQGLYPPPENQYHNTSFATVWLDK